MGFTAPNDFQVLQMTARSSNQRYSYLGYSDKSGSLTETKKLPKDAGIAVGYKIQKGNLVYFYNNWPGLEEILVYDYSTHSLQSYGNVGLEFPGFEDINPFSEKPFITQNIGFGENGYRTGIGFLNNEEWKFLEREDKLELRSGTVFKDKIYAYAANGEPPFEGDKILIYDTNFQLISEVDMLEQLGLIHGDTLPYIYEDNLFFIGANRLNELTIVEVSESLEILNATSYPNITYFSQCSLAEEIGGLLYLELIFHGENGKEAFQGGSSLIKIDFSKLDSDSLQSLPLKGHLLGINFSANAIFIYESTPQSETSEISIFDLDFDYQKTIEIEKIKAFNQARGMVPHIVDVNENLLHS